MYKTFCKMSQFGCISCVCVCVSNSTNSIRLCTLCNSYTIIVLIMDCSTLKNELWINSVTYGIVFRTYVAIGVI